MPSTSPVDPSGALAIERHFTKDFGGESPFDRVQWVVRDAWPDEPRYFVGGIRMPSFWTQNQLNIVSKLYLSKSETTPELDVQWMFERVAAQDTVQGIIAGYFGNFPTGDFDPSFKRTEAGRRDYMNWLRDVFPEHPASIFYDELCYLLLHGYGAFNSPVWFNVGRDDRDQQVSACFILGAQDTTESLTGNGVREVNIFRGGSGAGKSLGAIRGSKESLSGGGTASGPLSFMRADDAWAGTIKSGGKTRRAAKLVCLPADHPDILDFIDAKKREEGRLRILAENGLDISFSETGERNVAEVTSFQNANNSVTVTDEFMRKATVDPGVPENWPLINRTDGSVADLVGAGDILDRIAEAAHDCACPGLQFSDAMNRMHTTPTLDGVASPINSTNPCGEYMSNDDTSCNLASLNLMKFFDRKANGHFRTSDFLQAVSIFTTAMDILVEFAYYPDEIIGDRTRKLRQLGLGYANMGAIIMSNGWAYDSEEARSYAAAITSLMTATSYRQSALIAKVKGSFHYFDENSEAMIKVIETHASSSKDLHSHLIHELADGSLAQPIAADAATTWTETVELGLRYGYRNAQATVIAPTGTISFLMQCDTTGIEPGFQLVTYKELAGGGSMVLINGSVHEGLRSLGYAGYLIEQLEERLADGDIDAFLEKLASDEHRAVFASAGDISPTGHIKMMAAVQPFVSGSISKTINMDESVSVEDVLDAYVYAWSIGVKDLAIYRNNSKARQVLGSAPKQDRDEDVTSLVTNIVIQNSDVANVDIDPELLAQRIYASWKEGQQSTVAAEADSFGPPEHDDGRLERRRMPRTRQSLTHKIHVKSSLGENEGYIQVGMYPDGSPGELFVAGFGKHGGFTQNALSALATVMSIGLQYGIPLEVFTRKLAWVADETGGMVVPGDEPMAIRETKSIIDYIARWLIGQFGDVDQHDNHGVMTPALKARKAAELDAMTVVNVVSVSNHASSGAVDLQPSGNGATALVERVRAQQAGDGPACSECGTRMRRTGGCYTCPSCGLNTGCG